jgi:methylthioribose-1-phosphate isomerase
MIVPVDWKDDAVVLLDQRKLPAEEVYVTCREWSEVADAIREMIVRGAPAIGVTAAMGVALGALHIDTDETEEFGRRFKKICDGMAAARPTAVNLFWAIDRMRRLVEENHGRPLVELKLLLKTQALHMAKEDIEACKMIGRFGAALVPDGVSCLTHCNAGALATAGYGTALGVFRAAAEAGKKIRVFADETRPYLQGARLTAWELRKDNIPVTVITDNMAGYFLKKGEISLVVVGADRIAANGDTANKIGTYSVAVLARENNVPFYVAAPTSTLDMNIASGDDIPIEERAPSEVEEVFRRPIIPAGTEVRYPAFDVTPNRYIAAIITERGVARPPYLESLKKLVFP